jgi:hypothetical protein
MLHAVFVAGGLPANNQGARASFAKKVAAMHSRLELLRMDRGAEDSQRSAAKAERKAARDALLGEILRLNNEKRHMLRRHVAEEIGEQLGLQAYYVEEVLARHDPQALKFKAHPELAAEYLEALQKVRGDDSGSRPRTIARLAKKYGVSLPLAQAVCRGARNKFDRDRARETMGEAAE